MISQKIGTLLKKNTKNRVWYAKLAISLLLSNIFFFLLFSGKDQEVPEKSHSLEKGVEVQLSAQLLTPFQTGKKVLMVHRKQGRKIEGVLKGMDTESPERIVVLVKEAEAHDLFLHENWEIYPYLPKLSFHRPKKEQVHEISY